MAHWLRHQYLAQEIHAIEGWDSVLGRLIEWCADSLGLFTIDNSGSEGRSALPQQAIGIRQFDAQHQLYTPLSQRGKWETDGVIESVKEKIVSTSV